MAFAVAVVVVLAVSATAQGQEDPFIDEFGAGWVREPCPPEWAVDPDALFACYEGERGGVASIELKALFDGTTAAETQALVAAQMGGEPFEVSGIEGATGHVINADPAMLAVVAPTADHVVLVFVNAVDAVSPALEATIVDAARRQQEQAGGAQGEPNGTLSEAERELDRLLVDQPAEPGTRVIGTISIRDSFEDLRATARSQRSGTSPLVSRVKPEHHRAPAAG